MYFPLPNIAKPLPSMPMLREAFKLGDVNTDWQDEIYRVAMGTDHNLSMTGALKNMPYRVSVGYTNQNGTLKNNNYQRLNASIGLSPKFSTSISLLTSISRVASRTKSRFPPVSSEVP